MKKLLLTILAAGMILPASAGERTSDPSPVILSFPAAELPYNFDHGYRVPGMTKSLALSNDMAYLGHSAVDYACQPLGPLGRTLGLFSWDYFSTWFPLGSGWVHEEWHRAVMGRYGISSYDNIYKMNIGAETVSVSHVKDEDLAWLKLHHNDDMVRLMEAGNEANIEQTRVMRRDTFFTGRSTRLDSLGHLLSLLNVSFYVFDCTTSDANTMTDEFNRKEPKVSQRDFTGLDFTAWIYDLNRPDEPYSARGVHPLGSGTDRYIKRSDLSHEELRYLRFSAAMTTLNFVSPQLFGFQRFSGTDPFTGSELEWNGTMFHHLTSFGWDTGCDLFIQEGGRNIELVFHGYSNEAHFFPGLEAGIYRDPVSIAGTIFLISARTMVFLQPHDSQFHTSAVEPGGLVGAAIACPVASWCEVYIEGSVKSDGWVAGNVYLDRQAEISTGINCIL